MTDNLKTWHEEFLFRGDVKYIRSDLAKQLEIDAFNRGLAASGCITTEEATEREKQLISDAFADGWKTGKNRIERRIYNDDTDYDEYLDIKKIYRISVLEELK